MSPREERHEMNERRGQPRVAYDLDAIGALLFYAVMGSLFGAFLAAMWGLLS